MKTAAPIPQARLASLDQFRGYTVAGMFLVNYLGGFAACNFVLKHHNTYCSYADTIMPQFFFAVGFAMRLSFGRRIMQQGLGEAYWHMVKRLFGLVLVAIFITYHAHPPNGANAHWESMKELGWWHAVWPNAIKNTWFQTLTHIAVTSLWILPVIRLGATWRVVYLLFSAGLHLFLSYKFNFFWVNGARGYAPSGIDGGMLGFLSWSIPTLIGTLACDVALNPAYSGGRKVAQLVFAGVVLMGVGWLASWQTRIYDIPGPAEGRTVPKERFADHPVIPERGEFLAWWDKVKQRDWAGARAEYPFVPPPHSADPRDDGEPAAKAAAEEGSNFHRQWKYWMLDPTTRQVEDHSYAYRAWNYWMMSQRAGSISYLTFGAGISLVIYGLFYLLSDMVGVKVGVFRTLGVNALAGYVLADPVEDAVKNFTPRDVPPMVMWISFAVFFFMTWLFLRSLEKRKIYLKL